MEALGIEEIPRAQQESPSATSDAESAEEQEPSETRKATD